MTFIQEQKSRRTELLEAARRIAEKAGAANRDLTATEAATINSNLAAAKSISASIESARESEARSKSVFDSLDAMARSAGQGGISGHLSMTGTAAKSLATRIAAGLSAKAIPGTATTVSNILLPGVVEEGRPALSVLDVIPSRQVPSPVYSYLRQNLRDLKPAAVAPGDLKPTSDLGVESVQARLRVIAHVSSGIGNYILTDNQALSDFVQSEMVWGLRREIEHQVLLGDGQGENVTGLLNTSGIISQAFATDVLTSVRKSLTTLESNGYSPSAIILSPADWEKLELANVASGALDVRGLPVDSQRRALFGLPVALSTILPAKTGVVLGDGAAVVDSDGAIASKWSDSSGDDFSRNLLRLRTETRVNLSVPRPLAVVKVTTAA